MTRKFARFMLHVGIVGMFIAVAACNYDYDNINGYYADDKGPGPTGTSSVLSAGELFDRIQSGENVVVLDVDNITTVRSFIPGAVHIDYGQFEMYRNDGPGNAETNMMVASGGRIDNLIQEAGIDIDTTIVITGEWTRGGDIYTPSLNNVTRVWWVFHYWGFSRDKLKVLDGGNAAYAFVLSQHMDECNANNAALPAGATPTDCSIYAMAVTASTNEPSEFSVKDIPGNNIDISRAPIGEILDDVKSGKYESGEKILFSTVYAPVGFTIPDNPATPEVESGTVHVIDSGETNVFVGRIRGSHQLHTEKTVLTEKIDPGGYYIFKRNLGTADFIDEDSGAELLPADKDIRIITHCHQGYSTAPYNFAVREILGYRNVATYDGSMNEWALMAAFKATDLADTYVNAATKFEATQPVSFLTYNKDEDAFYDSATGQPAVDGHIVRNDSNLDGYRRWDTSRYTDYLYFILDDNGQAIQTPLDPDYSGDAREINREDKAYKLGE